MKTKKPEDHRILRPIAMHDKKSKRTYILQQTEHLTIDKKHVHFYQPNNISIFINIAHRQLGHAHKIYEKHIKTELDKSDKIDFKGRKLKYLYNYFEHIQSAIISIYTAIEALANVSIPTDFILEEINTKKVKEIWTKNNIERWKSTSDKIGDIVPEILKFESPKKLKIWSYFKQLEQIRNDIIHQKSERDPTKLDSKFLGKLLKDDIFKVVQSGFALIKYYCEKNQSHGFYPIGFHPIKLEPIVVDDFATHFALLDDKTEENNGT